MMSSGPTRGSHEDIEALIAADALGGLDEFDRRRLDRELERHGPDCEECRLLERRYAEVAGMLALRADPAPLSEGAEERLVQAAREGRTDEPGLPGVPVEVEAAGREGLARVGRARRLVATAAAAAALLVLGGVAGRLVAPAPSIQSRFLAFATQPGTRVVPFPSRGDQQLAVVFHPGDPSGWILGSGLPDLPGGRVYELWYLPSGGSQMQPGAIFLPDGGNIVAPVTVGQDFSALAVSVEPPGGSRQPTTAPIFQASLRVTL